MIYKNNNNLPSFHIVIPTKERYRHLSVWMIVWIFMVSGGLEAGWPLWFSIWTQTPYVLLFVLAFYYILYKVCPELHRSKLSLVINHLITGGGFILLYGLCNRIIPEYGSQWGEFPGYPYREDIADAMNMLIFICIPAYGLYYSKYYIALTRQNSKKEVLLAQKQEQLTRQELRFYKSQFNAHLTFNTLSHIYSKIMDQKEAAEPILLLSEILRYNTTTKADGYVQLSTEIAFLQNFIQIHKTIYPKLNIIFTINGKADSFKVLPRILVNFVENAIKHGVGNDPDFPISICLSVHDSLVFKVVNKVRSSTTANSTRMGLDITKQTLNTFYGNQYSLKIDQNQAMFGVCLEIYPVKHQVLIG